MSFEHLSFEQNTESEKASAELLTQTHERLMSLDQQVQDVLAEHEDLDINPSRKREREIRKFVQDAAKNKLNGHLDQFNVESFDTDGEVGLDKFEFEQFSDSLDAAIDQIILLDGMGAFKRAHKDANTDSLWNVAGHASNAVNAVTGKVLDKVLGKNNGSLAEVIANASGVSDEELRVMRDKKFNIKSADSWKDLAILTGMEIGEGVEDLIRLLVNIPGALLRMPEYTILRAKLQSSDPKVSTKARIEIDALVKDNPVLGLVELVGEKAIQVIKQLGGMITSGKQGDISMVLVSVAGLVAGGAGLVKIGAKTAKMGKLADIADSVAGKAGKIDDLMSGGLGHMTGQYSSKEKGGADAAGRAEDIVKTETTENFVEMGGSADEYALVKSDGTLIFNQEKFDADFPEGNPQRHGALREIVSHERAHQAIGNLSAHQIEKLTTVFEEQGFLDSQFLEQYGVNLKNPNASPENVMNEVLATLVGRSRSGKDIPEHLDFVLEQAGTNMESLRILSSRKSLVQNQGMMNEAGLEEAAIFGIKSKERIGAIESTRDLASKRWNQLDSFVQKAESEINLQLESLAERIDLSQIQNNQTGEIFPINAHTKEAIEKYKISQGYSSDAIKNLFDNPDDAYDLVVFADRMRTRDFAKMEGNPFQELNRKINTDVNGNFKAGENLVYFDHQGRAWELITGKDWAGRQGYVDARMIDLGGTIQQDLGNISTLLTQLKDARKLRGHTYDFYNTLDNPKSSKDSVDYAIKQMNRLNEWLDENAAKTFTLSRATNKPTTNRGDVPDQVSPKQTVEHTRSSSESATPTARQLNNESAPLPQIGKEVVIPRSDGSMSVARVESIASNGKVTVAWDDPGRGTMHKTLGPEDMVYEGKEVIIPRSDGSMSVARVEGVLINGKVRTTWKDPSGRTMHKDLHPESVRSIKPGTALDRDGLVVIGRDGKPQSNGVASNEVLKRHGELTDSERISTSEHFLLRPLSEREQQVLLKAHYVKQGNNVEKGLILMREGGFTKAETKILMDQGLAGRFKDRQDFAKHLDTILPVGHKNYLESLSVIVNRDGGAMKPFNEAIERVGVIDDSRRLSDVGSVMYSMEQSSVNRRGFQKLLSEMRTEQDWDDLVEVMAEKPTDVNPAPTSVEDIRAALDKKRPKTNNVEGVIDVAPIKSESKSKQAIDKLTALVNPHAPQSGPKRDITQLKVAMKKLEKMLASDVPPAHSGAFSREIQNMSKYSGLLMDSIGTQAGQALANQYKVKSNRLYDRARQFFGNETIAPQDWENIRNWDEAENLFS